MVFKDVTGKNHCSVVLLLPQTEAGSEFVHVCGEWRPWQKWRSGKIQSWVSSLLTLCVLKWGLKASQTYCLLQNERVTPSRNVRWQY